MLRTYDEQCDKKIPRMHVVFGAYDGPIDAKPGEKVVFIGDCARWSGTLQGAHVDVQSLYKDRSTKDPHHATHDDIFAKMAQVAGRFALSKLRGETFIRMQGCP